MPDYTQVNTRISAIATLCSLSKYEKINLLVILMQNQNEQVDNILRSMASFCFADEDTINKTLTNILFNEAGLAEVALDQYKRMDTV